MSQDREHPLWRTLHKLGAIKRGDDFILDGFDREFYLRFDVGVDEDNPKPGTCDIYVGRVGHSPKDSDHQFRLIADARESHVMRFIFALGINRFSDATRKSAYAMYSIVRTSNT